MGEPVTLWRYKCGATAVEFDSSPLWPDDEEYKALPAAEFTALTADRDALAALVAGAYEKCAKVAEDCACPLAREGIKSDRYGFCGHARCGHFHEAADAIRALARIDAASGRRG